MKVLFISDHFTSINGAFGLSKAHLDVIKNIVGDDNVFLVSIGQIIFKESVNSIYEFEPYNSKLSKMCNIFTLNYPNMNNTIIAECVNLVLKNQVDLVFVDESYFGKLVKAIKNNTQAIVMSFYHDVKANLFRQWIKEERKKRIPEFISGLINEKWTVKYSDYNIVLNNRESDTFFKYYNKRPDFEIPIILKSPRELQERKNSRKLLKLGFIGAYYYPNVKGIEWFCKNVMTSLVGIAELYVAGKNMEQLKVQFEAISNNIFVLGKVEELSDFYSNVDVVVAPIFEGAGMKVKTAEAFSYGKPFIGTTESLVGYIENVKHDNLDGYVRLCNNKDEFISSIESLAKLVRFNYYGTIKKHFESHYSYESAKRILKPFIEKISDHI